MKIIHRSFRILLSLTCACGLAAGPVSAELMPPTASPYSFGPEGRPIEAFQDQYGQPNEMMNILPNRPVAARDKNGNRVYFTPNGKLTLKVSPDGTMEFSVQGKTKQINADGELVRTMETEVGTNMVAVKNDKGEIIAYQELGLGGKVVKEYDYQMNATKTYQYDQFGKNVEFVLDELTMTRTVFDRSGQAQYDQNFEGTQVAWYHYDEIGKMTEKEDIRGNKTYFDKQGNMTHTVDKWGKEVMKYNYVKDEEGRYVLDTAVNYLGNITNYKNGKPLSEKTPGGEVLKEYVYDGQTLRYVFDTKLKETTWYGIDGRTLCTTRNDLLMKEWIYSRGKMVGIWDDTTNTLTAFIHGQEVTRFYIPDGKPSAETIQALIDAGVIKKNYDSTIDPDAGAIQHPQYKKQ